MDVLSMLRLANIVRQSEWDKEDGITAVYRGNELAGEVGEACNIIKKLERERLGIRGSRATPQDLGEELADAIICIDLIAMQFDVNLAEAIRAKFNATSKKYGLQTRFPETSKALADIAAERRRQVAPLPEGEGRSSQDDDRHVDGMLARAASCYADPKPEMLLSDGKPPRPVRWPANWSAFWWKPKDRRRDLVRAAALIVAEIERLDRAAAAPAGKED